MKKDDQYLDIFGAMIEDIIEDYCKYKLLSKGLIDTKSRGKRYWVETLGRSAFYFLYGGWLEAWLFGTELNKMLTAQNIRRRTEQVLIQYIDAARKIRQGSKKILYLSNAMWRRIKQKATGQVKTVYRVKGAKERRKNAGINQRH